jgi:ABC-type glycerol-3-phosphate transport system permease component
MDEPMTSNTIATPTRPTTDSSAVKPSGHRRRFPWLKSIVTFVLIPICALSFFPFLWMIFTSLRTQNTVLAGPFIPQQITFVAYGEAWNSIGFAQHFFNSVWITVATVIGVLVFSTISGYAFAILKFPFKNTLYLLLLTTLFMPATALIIPLYLQLKNLGLLNTQEGLVILYISSSAPFAMFLMRAFFQTLPDELVQAARIDGAGEFTIFWRIILPLARPGVATVVIFQFLSTWNEFLYANTVLQDTGKLPLQPVLFSLIGQYSTDWPTLTAGLTMSIIPVVLVYVFMQRQFVAGLTLGAVKS